MGLNWGTFAAGAANTMAAHNVAASTEQDKQQQLALAKIAAGRQSDQDALARFVAFQKAGATELQPGQSPGVQLQGTTLRNNLASGRNSDDTGPGAIPNSAFGIQDEDTPNAFGKPSIQQVGSRQVLVDPSKSPEAIADRRQASAFASRDRLQQQKDADAATAAKTKADALTAATTEKDRKDALDAYKYLQATVPTLKDKYGLDQLILNEFDPAAGDRYKLGAASAQKLVEQNNAYHAPKYGEFIDPKDATKAHHFIPEDEASRLGMVKAPTAGGAGSQAGGQTMAMLARLKQVSNDIGSADPEMTQFEDPKSPINITQVTPFLKTRVGMADAMPNAEAHGATGLFGNALTNYSSGYAQQGLSNPLEQGYRNYTTRQKTVGLGLGEVNPRPNNALIGIETSLSGADLGNDPNRTKSVQDRRRNAKRSMDAILAMNPSFVEAMQAQDPNWMDKSIKSAILTGVMPQGDARAIPTAKATITPAERTALKATGKYTDEQITARYGPP